MCSKIVREDPLAVRLWRESEPSEHVFLGKLFRNKVRRGLCRSFNGWHRRLSSLYGFGTLLDTTVHNHIDTQTKSHVVRWLILAAALAWLPGSSSSIVFDIPMNKNDSGWWVYTVPGENMGTITITS